MTTQLRDKLLLEIREVWPQFEITTSTSPDGRVEVVIRNGDTVLSSSTSPSGANAEVLELYLLDKFAAYRRRRAS